METTQQIWLDVIRTCTYPITNYRVRDEHNQKILHNNKYNKKQYKIKQNI
jgi:hypothetical protein